MRRPAVPRTALRHSRDMQTYREGDHPRGADGRWATKHQMGPAHAPPVTDGGYGGAPNPAEALAPVDALDQTIALAEELAAGQPFEGIDREQLKRLLVLAKPGTDDRSGDADLGPGGWLDEMYVRNVDGQCDGWVWPHNETLAHFAAREARLCALDYARLAVRRGSLAHKEAERMRECCEALAVIAVGSLGGEHIEAREQASSAIYNLGHALESCVDGAREYGHVLLNHQGTQMRSSFGVAANYATKLYMMESEHWAPLREASRTP